MPTICWRACLPMPGTTLLEAGRPVGAGYLEREKAYLMKANPRAAATTLRRLQAAFRMLAAHPNAGSPVLPLAGRRRFVEALYVIDYRVEADAILISAIRHGRQQGTVLDVDEDDDFEVPGDS